MFVTDSRHFYLQLMVVFDSALNPEYFLTTTKCWQMNPMDLTAWQNASDTVSNPVTNLLRGFYCRTFHCHNVLLRTFWTSLAQSSVFVANSSSQTRSIPQDLRLVKLIYPRSRCALTSSSQQPFTPLRTLIRI